MSRETWTYDELFEGLDPAPSFVTELERLGLLRVVGRDARGRPLYGREARDELDKVRGLVELGYQPRDIAAIARKVGLPARRRRLFRRAPTFIRLDALAKRSGVDAARLADWAKRRLIEPGLISDGGEELFAPALVERMRLLDELPLLGGTDEDVTRWARLLAALGDDGADGADGADDQPLPRLMEALEAALDTLEAQCARRRAALRRWDKLAAGLRKRITRVRRVGRDARPTRAHVRRVRARTRGRRGPGSGPEI